MKIGIFDSGLGGLFLTKAITEFLPEYDYVYLGDTKNVPYGNRSKETVYEFTKDAVDYTLVQVIAHDGKDRTLVIEGPVIKRVMTEEDREAAEDYDYESPDMGE